MGATSLFFDIFGRDQGVGEMFDKVEGKAKGMSPALAGIGTAMAAGLAGLGTAIVKTGLDEVSDASAGMAQLEAGIKSTGNAANVSVQGMEDLASSIQDYSGQTDDSIVSAESLLLTFTNIKNQGPNKIFDEATTAAANMAAKLGGDASSQAMVLGKALNDPVQGLTALKRAGVSFTDAQVAQITAMQKSGDTMGAQKIILSELNKEFGGAAKAAGDSLPGQVQKSKRSFEDLSQNLMQALLPALTKAAEALTNVTKWFSQNQGAAIALGAVVAVLAAGFIAASIGTMAHTVALGIHKVAIGISTAAQWLFNAAMDANPIGLVVVALAALIAIIVLVATHWSEITGFLTDVWNGFISWMKGLLDGFSGWWGDLWGGVGDFLTTLWGNLVSGVSDTIGKVLGFFGDLPSKVLGAIGDATGWLYQVGKDIINGLVNGITNVIGTVSDTIKNGIGGAINGVKDMLGIHSPSLVFHEIGQNIGLGLAGGVDSQGPNVAGSMRSLVSVPAIGAAITSGLSHTASQLPTGQQPGMSRDAGGQMPSTMVLRVGDREFTAYVSEVADARVGAGISGANDDAGRRPSR